MYIMDNKLLKQILYVFKGVLLIYIFYFPLNEMELLNTVRYSISGFVLFRFFYKFSLYLKSQPKQYIVFSLLTLYLSFILLEFYIFPKGSGGVIFFLFSPIIFFLDTFPVIFGLVVNFLFHQNIKVYYVSLALASFVPILIILSSCMI